MKPNPTPSKPASAQGTVADHECIWLEPPPGGSEGRLWCQDKVWPADEGDPEPTEYIRADLAASPEPAASPPSPGEVRIKPLSWREPEKLTNGCWTAECILGTFSVAFDDGWYACLEEGARWEWEPENDPRSYEGPFAAQAACQAFLDSRIRSALASDATANSKAGDEDVRGDEREAIAKWHDEMAARHYRAERPSQAEPHVLSAMTIREGAGEKYRSIRARTATRETENSHDG